MKKSMKQFHYAEKGFTLMELVVVIAILAIIAVVVVPNVGQFIGRGKTEAYATELYNVRTAVTAMLAESTAGELDATVSATDEMDEVTADNGALVLSSYLTGLDANGKVTTGCTYAFAVDGTVTQTTP